MTVCRESGAEATDDLYPRNKPGQEQNFEIHSPRGSVNISFHFPQIQDESSAARNASRVKMGL